MTYLEGTDADPLSEMSRHAGDLRHLLRSEHTAVHKLHAAVGHGTDRVHSTALTATTSPAPAACVCIGNRTNLVDALNLSLNGLT